MKVLSTLLFLSITLLSFGQDLPTTKHQPLPCNYHLVENLYLSPNKNRFIFHESNTPAKSILPKADRSFFSYDSSKLKYFDYYTNTKTLPNTTLIFFERASTQHFSYHYYHVLEHLLGAWSFYLHDKRFDVSQVVIASDGTRPQKTIYGPNFINYHLIKAAFPKAKLSALYNVGRTDQRSLFHFEKAVISDRHQTDRNPLHKPTEVHLSPALDLLKPEHFESLAQALRSYLKIKQTPSEFLRVTYVLRQPPRHMDEEVRKKLFKLIASYKNIKLRCLDFAKMSFKDQVEVTCNTDLLIGVHGNGLSHLITLPKDGAIFEIFPNDVHTFHYRHLAEGKDIRYYGMKSNQLIDKKLALDLGMIADFDHETSHKSYVVKDINYKAIKTIIEKELALKGLLTE